MIILYILAVLFIAIPVAAGEVTVKPDRVIFANGNTLKITPSTTVSAESPDAAQNDRVASIREIAEDIPEWKGVLLQRRKSLLLEGEIKDIELYNYEGQPKLVIHGLSGDLELLRATERIIFFSSSAHFATTSSMLFDSQGRFITAICHGQNLLSHGVSKDQKVFWLLIQGIDGSGKPALDVRAFDIQGQEIYETRVSEAKTVTFEYRDSTYRIEVPKPELPG